MTKKLGLVAIFGLALCLVFTFSSLTLKFNLFQSFTGKIDKQVPQASPIQLSLGTNLSGISDWSTEMPFVDAFKSSRPWITQCLPEEPGCLNAWNTNESEQLNLDKYGWVKSLPTPEDPPEYTRVSTLMFRDVGFYPAGRYVVLYDGEGTIEYKFDAHKDESASTLGRDVLEVNSSQKGIYLSIISTDPHHTGNYIRNLHVVPEQYELNYEQELFNPAFLNKIRPFKTLRFMDWMGTNNSQQGNWLNRPKVKNHSYFFQSGGVPVEIMLALANRLEANPWFNMPHLAQDNYIENFARIVKDSLHPSLHVYVEYSNEVWNDNFSQGNWVEEQGIAEWFKESYDDNQTKRINWYGERTAQMCEIWKGVFELQSERVICVLSSQAAQTRTATEALECPLWSESPCFQHGIDALAIAPYVGGYLGNPQHRSQVQTWTISQLFQELLQGGVLTEGPSGGAIQQTTDWMNANFRIAKERNLPLIAYEGGQHLVDHGEGQPHPALTALFIAANRDSYMYDVYLNYLNQWTKVGGTLFMHWLDIGRYSQWGSWGALESVAQDSSPKYNALLDFIEQNSVQYRQ